jgi:hypothetical protein
MNLMQSMCSLFSSRCGRETSKDSKRLNQRCVDRFHSVGLPVLQASQTHSLLINEAHHHHRLFNFAADTTLSSAPARRRWGELAVLHSHPKFGRHS